MIPSHLLFHEYHSTNSIIMISTLYDESIYVINQLILITNHSSDFK